MKKLLPFLVLVVLSACSDDPKERVYTVDELIGDDALRAEILEKCKNNPGELGQTPNCVNAPAANWKARMRRMQKEFGG